MDYWLDSYIYVERFDRHAGDGSATYLTAERLDAYIMYDEVDDRTTGSRNTVPSIFTASKLNMMDRVYLPGDEGPPLNPRHALKVQNPSRRISRDLGEEYWKCTL